MIVAMNEKRKKAELGDPDRDGALPPYAPSYDEEELEAAIEKGSRAWADVPDAVAWVRELRGTDDD